MAEANLIRWAVGWDPKEAAAWHAMAQSLLSKSSLPISIIPVSLGGLGGVLTRPRDPLQSNDFSFSRFLVPWMMGFDGWAVWSDPDMLVTVDPAELWAMRDDRYAIQCVKHDHQPTEDRKYLGNRQTRYARKNWSSLMLLNCRRLQMLTPEYVNHAHGLDLHQFQFLQRGDEAMIGELPVSWNYLVGHNEPGPEVPSLIHWTSGSPCLAGYEQTEHSHLFWSALQDAVSSAEPPSNLRMVWGHLGHWRRRASA